MDRLTKRIDGGIERVCHYGYGEERMCYGCVQRAKCTADIFERLAAYEDTGLGPEDMAAVRLLALAPTVDAVEVVHGRWEEQDYNWSEAWKCSACGEEWCFEHDPTEPTTRVNYCPNCGAKMDLEG